MKTQTKWLTTANFKTADLVGLDTQIRLCEAFYPITLDPRASAPPLLRRMVAAGQLGRKSGRGFFVYDGNAMFGG